ncbi:MAG: hypothetical protein CVU39_27875 [Chloroflexi bacterium HGW-Chloroflexi-10]|nr:MAG: hypothetical protein CVU39_27875 [Chloroflexi bacterium HGW-Chloroflexi-10]
MGWFWEFGSIAKGVKAPLACREGFGEGEFGGRVVSDSETELVLDFVRGFFEQLRRLLHHKLGFEGVGWPVFTRYGMVWEMVRKWCVVGVKHQIRR